MEVSGNVGQREIVRRGREKKSFRVGKATLAVVLVLFGSLGEGDGSGPGWLEATLRFFRGTNEGVDGLEPFGSSEMIESAAASTMVLNIGLEPGAEARA